MHRVVLVASLLSLAAQVQAQSDAWAIALARTTGSLEETSARSVVEAARSELAACASPGASYVYELSLRTNGTVREAAYDRHAATDARGARCIRHALLELHFPAHDQASTFTLTLGAGGAAAPSASAPSPSAPPTTTIPTGAPPPSTAPIAPGSVDVRIGALAASAERSADVLRSVIAAQLGALSVCFATGSRSDPSLAGDATLHVTIAADGRVTGVLFQAPEALATRLAACVG